MKEQKKIFKNYRCPLCLENGCHTCICSLFQVMKDISTGLYELTSMGPLKLTDKNVFLSKAVCSIDTWHGIWLLTSCCRYSMVVENGVVTQLNVEPDGKGLSCSLAPDILKTLWSSQSHVSMTYPTFHLHVLISRVLEGMLTFITYVIFMYRENSYYLSVVYVWN